MRLLRFAVIVPLLLSAAPVLAVTCTAATGAVNWNAVATWSCGHVPANGDDVVIPSGSTTTLNANSNSLASLTVSGALIVAANLNVNFTAASPLAINSGATVTIGNNATSRAVVVTGDITVAGTFSVGATAATHTLTAGGNISNTGTINFAPSGTRVCNVTFNENGNQTVSGAGAYTFNRITLNMGAARANTLDMRSAMTAPAGFLTITNGTYKHSNSSNITPWTADPSIPANGGFWLNAAATVSTGNFNLTLNGGLLQVSAGTMNVGTANSNFVMLNNFASSSVLMQGGSLNASGGIASSGNNGAGSFSQTGGTLTMSTVSPGPNETFMLGTATTFSMSGGTMILQIANNANDDLNIQSSTQTVSGGTVQVGSPALTGTNPFLLTNTAGTSLNFWNLVLYTTGSPTTYLGDTTNIWNDLTIQSGATLNNGGGIGGSCSCAINVGAGNVGGNWTNNGAFVAGTSTVTFTGTGAAPAIGGTAATTFNNLTMNKASNNLTINTSPTVNATLTFTSGDIVTGGNRVILGTAATIATPSASSYVQGNLQKNYSAGANLSYFGGNDFPVGDATNFTPVNVSAGTTTTAGSLTVSTLTPDHPQVTTPIASTGIDAAKSVNRYWRFNNSGLTVGTAISATFTFVAGDVNAGANTANFIVQRYDGTNWNPTTLVAANPLNTQASNITPLAAGNNDFAIGEPLSGFNAVPGAFNAFETSTPANSILGRIYTKIVGTAITLQVVAVNAGRTGVNTAYNTNPITVALLDARDNTGAITASTNCRSTWTTVISTQSLSPTWTNGRSATINITAPANAWRDVRVQVTQGGNVGCSSDRFAIRPTAFSSVTSNMNNSGTSGTPSLKTGQNFTINALTGLSGYDNGSGATLANPAIIPLIDNTQVIGSPNAGAIGGSFGAASGGTASGTSFYYSEVGNFGFNANAIYDNVFTAVDQPLDCTADFSNSQVGGEYGCNFGSPAVALASGFGRFIPDNFAVSLNTPQFGTACGAGTFTYVGQTFNFATAPVITVTARNGTNNGLTNAPTTNYAGAYMKLSNAAGTSLNQSPYNTQDGRYARFDALGGGTTPALDTSGLPATTADPVIGTFASGQGTLTFGSGTGFAFTRSTTTPNAPFSADIALALNVIDTDGVAFAGNPASFGAATSGNGIAFNSGNAFRYGRIQMQNANGSELLNLPLGLKLQYWAGTTGWQINSSDSCTAIAAANFAFSFPVNPKNLLAACETAVTVTGSAPNYTVSLAKPGAGNNGWTDVTLNLGSTASGNQCTTVGGPGGAATTANAPWLQYNWTGAVGNPAARATFGVFKSGPVIFRREMY